MVYYCAMIVQALVPVPPCSLVLHHSLYMKKGFNSLGH